MPRCGGTTPRANLSLHAFVLPKPHNNFSIQTHSAHNEAVLAITMSRLVKVHEIHVDGRPGNITIVLCMEVEQRFPQQLQSVDPHLRRRESMAPGD